MCERAGALRSPRSLTALIHPTAWKGNSQKFASPWQNGQRWKRNKGRAQRHMAIDKVLADVAVDDFASALTWYERLLGRPADAEPMDGLAEWHLAEGGGSK